MSKASWQAAAQSSDRRFHIIMATVVAVFVLLMVALVWAIVATEPQRRAAYMTKCQGKGFSQEQCQFLYSERQRQDADDGAAIAISASLAAQAALQRSYGR